MDAERALPAELKPILKQHDPIGSVVKWVTYDFNLTE